MSKIENKNKNTRQKRNDLKKKKSRRKVTTENGKRGARFEHKRGKGKGNNGKRTMRQKGRKKNREPKC